MLISTNGARQPKELPSINPIGTPNTSDQLIPMTTNPMARPTNLCSTILEAIVIHNTINKEPLIAETIRAIIKNVKLGLNIAMIFPIKNTLKDIIVSFFLSIDPVETNKIGAAMAKTSENTVINSPAFPSDTFKSVATKSSIPPIISSTIPTIKETIVNK